MTDEAKEENIPIICTMSTEDLDDLIEYCPESPTVEENETQLETPPTKIILVCSLCLREYDLKEDLRGHMIEFHKYKPREMDTNPYVAKNNTTTQEEPMIDDLNTNKKSIVTQEAPVVNDLYMNKKSVITQEEPNIVNSSAELEMKPMPFKAFRLLLRSKLLLKCSECQYTFETNDKLEKHKKCHEFSTAGTLFKCFVCCIQLQNWRKCTAHLWKMHKIDLDILSCPICSYRSHASALVWRHMRVHKKWRQRVLSSLKAVKERRLKTENPIPIRVAEKKKPTPTSTASKKKYYAEKTCEICNRKFVNGKTLSKHIQTVHKKIKPFNCNVCGKKTARKASLIIHMRQHNNEKPLHCDFESCKFSTRDPSVLHKHKMRHERSTNANVGKKCPRCSYTCIQANAIKRHIRKKHQDLYKSMSCDLCTFVSINSERLKAHKEDHLKGLIRNKNEEDGTRKMLAEKRNEVSTDCFLPIESVDSLPHEPVDTGGLTIPASSEDSQFPTHF